MQRSFMKYPLITLVMMQIKEKFNLKFLKSRKKTAFTLIFKALQFVIATVALYALFYLSVFLKVLSFNAILYAETIMLIFIALQVMAIITTTVGLVKSLYLSGDNELLLTFPVSANKVFLSKLIVFFINELRKNYLLFLPMFVAFGILDKMAFYYYLWVLAAYVLISFMPVIIGALLSIPSLFVALLLRNAKYVQLAFAAVAASAIVAVVFALVSRIPENLDIVGQASKYFTEIQSFLKQAGQTFVVFRLLTAMITGNEIFRNQRDVFVLPQIATLGIYILVLAGIAAAAYFIERKLFFYMASRPNEHRKRLQKERGNRTSGVLLSAVKKETLSFVRSPAGFFANYIMVFALPFAIYLLNKIFASMHTRLLGDQLAMGFNILMILLIMMSTNMSMASVFSSDGKAAYSLKTNPQTLRNTVISKTVIHFALTLISLGVTAVIVYTVAKFSAADTVFLFFSMLFINIGHVFWSVEMDIVKPQYNKYFGGVHIGANPNEVKSVAAAFIISFAFFGVSLFFFTDKMSVAWIKLTLIAAAFLGVRIWLLINRGKVYFGDF